ncbi:MAG: FAD-binding protein [Anaerolineaceae bacterium]|nr:FAD-binding protein [Anaerolineaceae bacterium]
MENTFNTLDEKGIETLVSLLGKDHVLTSLEDRIVYGYDASAPARDGMPAAIVFPENTEQVSAIMQMANEKRIPVVPRGSGTGLSGATVPHPGSIVMLFTRMNQILEIDDQNLTATVQPGLLTLDLVNAVEAEGLFYAPDPSSMKVSTMGGNVALNAGGLRGLKYGVTRDFVMGLEVVLANGEILSTGNKCKKDVAGLNLTSLFVGSEGILGIITEVLVRLIPLPEDKRTAVAFFDEIETAATVVSQIIAARIVPVTLEILDQLSIQCVEEFASIGLPTEAGAMLLIETDGPTALVEEEIQKIREICIKNKAISVEVATDTEHVEKLKSARRSTLAALARRRPTTILEDVTVPRSQIPEMVRRIRKIAEKQNVEIAIFGHAGDGNLHPTGMTDARDSEELHRVEAAFEEIFEAALDLGGTITGEHGVGTKKRHVLPVQIGAVGFKTMQSIKAVFDPQGILNPGKVL